MKTTFTRLRPFLEPTDMKHALQLQKRLEAETPESMKSHYQTLEWAKFMSWLLGKSHVELWTQEDTEGRLVAVTWLYLYPMKYGKYWLYTPRGPIGDGGGLLPEIIRTHRKQAVWLRWDPLFEDDRAQNYVPGAKSAHASFQPKSTLLLDLSLGAEALLAQMKSKGRYNIRLAGKKGVEVWAWTVNSQGAAEAIGPNKETAPNLTLDDLVATYTKLSRETNARDAFAGHGAEYFREFLGNLSGSAHIRLARVCDEWVAGGIFLQQGTLATYYYGASSNRHREKMAPYLVQWSAIAYAIASGCTTYDFLGIATPGSKDPADLALAGVTDFKLKFGGHIQTRGQAFEKSISPFWFFLVRLAKSIRRIISSIKRG